MDEVINSLNTKCSKSLDSLEIEFSKIRTGRAHPSLLDRVSVDYYGTPTKLNQLATINTPDARLLTVQPFDKSIAPAIEKAIHASDLGLNPSSEGHMIRIPIPPLTEERRKEMVKLAKKFSEEAKVSMRNHRRDANDALKKAEKSKEISEDDLKRLMDSVQTSTNSNISKIDSLLAEKEKEILTV